MSYTSTDKTIKFTILLDNIKLKKATGVLNTMTFRFLARTATSFREISTCRYGE